MIKGVKDFRADTEKKRSCVWHSIPMTKCYENDSYCPPTSYMKGELIQHHIETQEDMIGMHDSLDLKPKILEPIPEDFDTKAQISFNILVRRASHQYLKDGTTIYSTLRDMYSVSSIDNYNVVVFEVTAIVWTGDSYP